MKIRCLCLLTLLGFCAVVRAEAPPQKLLPRDTVLVITMPDASTGLGMMTNSAMGRLWRDGAMKPFRDKFMDKLKSAVAEPLERELGIKLADYPGLARGQITLAILRVDRPEKPGEQFAAVFLLDVGDQTGPLATNLAAVRKKWIEAGKALKTQKIRELDFTTLLTSVDSFSASKLLPKIGGAGLPEDLGAKPSGEKVELTFGQSGSLLIVSQAPEAIEKILARQAGELLPGLEEQPVFQNDYAARLHDAPVFAWVNVKALIEYEAKPSGAQGGGSILAAALASDGALTALGLNDLTSASLAYHDAPDGMRLQFFVGAPEAGRRGLLKVFTTTPKDSGPPPFVPADAVKFSRMRLDIPKSWRLVEGTLNELNPTYVQLLNFVLDSAGKDKDPAYDLRGELLANLGDDIITYQRNPRENTLGELKAAPELYLVGSPDAEKLAAALKVALRLVVPSDSILEREFLGRKIYSATLPFSPQGGSHSFHFAAGGGYVAMTGDVEMLEEFLRNGGGAVKGLKETSGLADAAQDGGGLDTGMFSFSNDRESMRALTETLRKQPVSLGEFLDLMGLPSTSPQIPVPDEITNFKEWADFSLLPPGDALSKYFFFSVWVGKFTPDGFALTCFAPTPH